MPRVAGYVARRTNHTYLTRDANAHTSLSIFSYPLTLIDMFLRCLSPSYPHTTVCGYSA
jgi:hypothetical protein